MFVPTTKSRQWQGAPTTTFLCLVALACMTAGCPSEDGPGGDGDVTWHQDVAPIIAEHCQSCHSPGGIGPFSLETYAEAQPIAGWIAQVTEDGIMPPFDAKTTAECSPPLDYKNDPSLSSDELATLREWASSGAAEGDPATAASLPALPDLSLARVDASLTMPAAVVVSGAEDDFQCIVFEPDLDARVWVTGVEVRPSVNRSTWTNEERASTPSVLHHVVLFTDPSGASADRQDLGEANNFTCFGGPEVEGFSILGTYVPGSIPNRFPEDSGMALDPGMAIVAQAHLSPAPGISLAEQFELHLQWETTEPTWNAEWRIYGAVSETSGNSDALQPGPNDTDGPEFRIPGGATGHTETFRYTEDINAQVPLFGVLPHMHLAGTDIKTSILRDSGDDSCLVHVPEYDFTWQRSYLFEGQASTFPTIGGSDTLEIRCTYDNSMDNPAIGEAVENEGLSSPPDLFAGDNTLDEMCAAVLGILTP